MKHGEEYVRKPTAFMTNAPCIADALNKRCTKDHMHVPCCGKAARKAEVYPDELCKSILNGLVKQMKEDGRMMNEGIGTVTAVE